MMTNQNTKNIFFLILSLFILFNVIQTSRIPVWLDCDPGIDDALAMLLAGHNSRIKLLGISTTFGNQDIQKTTNNALGLAEFFDMSEVDINQGFAYKYLEINIPISGEKFHGESGFADVVLPVNKKPLLKQRLLPHMFEVITSQKEKVTIIAVGPLTNIALFLKAYPDVKNYIEEIAVMGGAIGQGNVAGLAAEFNIFNDPHAAHVVFHSGIKVIMFPLDVTHQLDINEAIKRRISELNSRISRSIISSLDYYTKMIKKHSNVTKIPLHDPCPVAYIINKDLFETTFINVEVEIDSVLSRGRTLCDLHNFSERTPNVHVATKVHVEEFWKVMFAAINQANEKSLYGRNERKEDI